MLELFCALSTAVVSIYVWYSSYNDETTL